MHWVEQRPVGRLQQALEAARSEASAADAAAVAALVMRSGPSVGRVRVVCVDGPAGAGKTTLLRHLLCNKSKIHFLVNHFSANLAFPGFVFC